MLSANETSDENAFLEDPKFQASGKEFGNLV